MINLADVPEDELSQTQKQMKQHILERGWQAHVPYKGSAHYYITRNDGKKLHVFSSTPPTTSYAAGALANDKYATYEVVKERDVPQLSTIKVSLTDEIDDAVAFVQREGVVVVKPIDGAHGKGITMNVTNEHELREAIDIGLKATSHVRAVLVQKQYPYEMIYDLRIVYIGYEYVAALQRVAARVYGDGIHTVGELIEIENSTARRGKAYYAPLATINLDLAKVYLKDRISTVPEEHEEFQVLGIANYGAGGETVDVTDNLPDWLITYGEQASRACELAVSGVDFMLARFPERHHSKEELDVAMTEINKAPLLTMHTPPTSGTSRDVVARYIDYLSTIE